MSQEQITKPKATHGLRHVALFVSKFDECKHFYVELLGMNIDWQPDADNLYLSSGYDNLALHRAPSRFQAAPYQRLDHIGFIINEIEQVDVWCEYLRSKQVRIKAEPRTHRDGARSFYCLDPEGILVQMMYYPPLSDSLNNAK